MNHEEHTQLRIERIVQRRTQRAVAIEIGIAPSVLSDYELGYRTLPGEVIARLRSALSRRAA